MDMLVCRASGEKRLQNQRESHQSGEDQDMDSAEGEGLGG